MDRNPPRPYDSFGNGAAMRVSPAAYLSRHADLAAFSDSFDRLMQGIVDVRKLSLTASPVASDI